jgi:L-serine dehydratase
MAMNKKIPSIFNHVLGPIMRGPSSSHTAASVRIGMLGRRLLGEPPVEAVFTFDPSGSLATTYRGQGSAMGLAAGLLGMSITDPRLPMAEELCREYGLSLTFHVEPYGAVHPNTYQTELVGGSGASVQFTVLSTGGGIIQLVELNGAPIEDDLDLINPLMPLAVIRNPDLPFGDAAEFAELLRQKGGRLSDYALAYETTLGATDDEHVLSLANEHLAVMHDAMTAGLAGTDYDDRILPRQSHLISRARESASLIPAGLVNHVIEAVTAMMETKSAMGVIAAAPTAGSSGTIGGVLFPVAKELGKGDEELARALLAAGLVGVFIARRGGFAAEEGGCQYECGAASGMAAAALVELMGGDGMTALNAASMALQNCLGMICDPVADRVEVPCLGKNIMAALNALASANMALAGYEHLIPLDEVILAMQEVGSGMDHKYRCTCKGGLSLTPTAQKVFQRLGRG